MEYNGPLNGGAFEGEMVVYDPAVYCRGWSTDLGGNDRRAASNRE